MESCGLGYSSLWGYYRNSDYVGAMTDKDASVHCEAFGREGGAPSLFEVALGDFFAGAAEDPG